MMKSFQMAILFILFGNSSGFAADPTASEQKVEKLANSSVFDDAIKAGQEALDDVAEKYLTYHSFLEAKPELQSALNDNRNMFYQKNCAYGLPQINANTKNHATMQAITRICHFIRTALPNIKEPSLQFSQQTIKDALAQGGTASLNQTELDQIYSLYLAVYNFEKGDLEKAKANSEAFLKFVTEKDLLKGDAGAKGAFNRISKIIKIRLAAK